MEKPAKLHVTLQSHLSGIEVVANPLIPLGSAYLAPVPGSRAPDTLAVFCHSVADLQRLIDEACSRADAAFLRSIGIEP
jgi:hypothetical protein